MVSPSIANTCRCFPPLQLPAAASHPFNSDIVGANEEEKLFSDGLLFPPATGKPTRGGDGEGLDALDGQSSLVARRTRPLFVCLTRGEQSPQNERPSHLRDVFKCLAAQGLSRNRSRNSFGEGQVSLSTADKKRPV